MSVSKDAEKNTWTVQCYYTDWTGSKKHKKKRNFATKKEAQEWEREFLQSQTADLNMSMEAFMEIYFRDKAGELKERTLRNKKYLLNAHVLPYFQNKSMSAITPSDIIQWQNEISKKGYKDTYLRMIQNQLTALFTHAERIYNLKDNPCKKVRRMGKSDADELEFWTEEEYAAFISTLEEGSKYYVLFETLFWTGCRIGELLALTKSDIDFRTNQIRINKTYYRVNRRDVITKPKTEQSNRIIEIPEFLTRELRDYTNRMYGLPDNERIFPIVPEAVQHKLKYQVEKAGVKYIRVHDFRHSHVAYLINKGVQPLLIKERLGHKDIRITLNTYGHLYPNQQRQIAELLDNEKLKSPGQITDRDGVINKEESLNIDLSQVDYSRDSSGGQSLSEKKGTDNPDSGGANGTED